MLHRVNRETVSLVLSHPLPSICASLFMTPSSPWASCPHKIGIMDTDIYSHNLGNCMETGLFPDNSSENNPGEGSDWFGLGHVGLRWVTLIGPPGKSACSCS